VVAQGEFWLLEKPSSKPRPVLVVTRNEAIPVLNSVIVAPVTSTIRNIATNILVGADEGLDYPSVASFDNLRVVPQAFLTRRLGGLDPLRLGEICRALEALADC
jgi:mRNA interferase MazF